MSDKITLVRHNYDTNTDDAVGETSTYILARSMKSEDVSRFLADYLNAGMKDFREGTRIGKLCHSEHRTIQASIIRFCLGIIIGLSEQEYTDARNETPVAMGKQIAKMIENGELKMGWMI